MTKTKKIGAGLLIASPVLLTVFILVSRALSNQRFSFLQTSSLGRTIFILLGVLSMLGVFIGIPVGIYLLIKRKTMSKDEYIEKLRTQEPYKNLTTDQIKYITSSSLGAFFATPIWALGNKLFLEGVLSFLPLLNLYYWFQLTGSGRKMAWEKGGWTSFDQFKKRQKIMAWIVLVFFILSAGVRIADIKDEMYKTSNSEDLYGTMRLR